MLYHEVLSDDALCMELEDLIAEYYATESTNVKKLVKHFIDLKKKELEIRSLRAERRAQKGALRYAG
jgi:hypothetical protein